MRLPHPLVLLLLTLAAAATLTWILPAGEFTRRHDDATGRTVVVAGTYHEEPRTPVGPLKAALAIAQGFVDAADVIAVVLFVGGAWVLVDRLGSLSRIVRSIAGMLGERTMLAIPIVSLFFASMGALENMQEEIIPLVPVLLLLGRHLGVDAVTVVAMSAGSAMIGSAYGPTNPFQAGIAMKLAELPAASAFGVRVALFVAGYVLWTGWTMVWARRARATAPELPPIRQPATPRDVVIVLCMLLPMAAYVYGATALDWGFNELSAGFIIGAILAGAIGGLGAAGTTTVYLEGMQALLPAALMIAVARSISVALAEGHVIDTILERLSAPLALVPPAAGAMLMVPFHLLIHVAVPSVSSHAVLTMPLLVPLSDLAGISRQATVLAYQIGAGLGEMVTPTNGALMAILLAAGVPYGRWMRFAIVGIVVSAVAGLVAMGAL